MALCGASLAKDEFNAARIIARPVYPASAVVAARLAVFTVYKETNLKIGKKSPPAQTFPNYSNS